MHSSQDTSVTVSIIIPHWNGKEVLGECLQSLQASRPPGAEIIVVDNASTDGSAAWIRAEYPQVILVANTTNKGYAGGCNSGARQARGAYLLFLNNDTVHTTGWIERLVEALDRNPDLAAVQPKILNYFQRDSFDYAGGSGGELDLFVYPFTRGRIFQTQEIDRGQYENPTDIFWASGTANLVRAELFHEAGGFDESFFAHMEEIDLCWRFHLMGKRVGVIPASVVYHRNAVTLTMYSYRKYYLNHRNSMLLLMTNYSLPLTIYLFPFRFALEWVALVYAFVLRDWNHIGGILAALGWFLTHPGHILRRRRWIKSLRKKKDRQIIRSMYPGSIVWSYYILGRKTYGLLARTSPK